MMLEQIRERLPPISGGKILPVAGLALYAGLQPTAAGLVVNGSMAGLLALHGVGMLDNLHYQARKSLLLCAGCVCAGFNLYGVHKPLSAIAMLTGAIVAGLAWHSRSKWATEIKILQCETVNCVLSYLSHGASEDVSQAWQSGGRARVASVLRQSLERLTWEHEIDGGFKASYFVGYLDGLAELQPTVDALQDELQNAEKRAGQAEKLANTQARQDVDSVEEWAEEQIQRLTAETARLRQALIKAQAQTKAPQTPLDDAFSEWGKSSATLDELMKRQGWQRIEKHDCVGVDETLVQKPIAEAAQAIQPEQGNVVPLHPLPEEKQDSKGIVLQLEAQGLSKKAIAERLGLPLGTVKSICSRAKKQVAEGCNDDLQAVASP